MANKNVKAELLEGFRVLNQTRGLEWYADEPREEGGEDTAPRPSEILLSALTSCKLITMKMYANRKDWNVEGMKLNMEIVEEGEKWLVRKEIIFPDHLTEEQKERLKVISTKCPIAKRLMPVVEYL